MTEQHADGGRFARWREHRRVKRQEVREREYFAAEQAHTYEGALAPTATDRLNASAHARSYGTTSSGFWGGFGGDCGDGGGC